MKSVPASEFKANFSKLLREVRQGSVFEIVSDEDGTPIAVFEPVSDESLKRKVVRPADNKDK